MSDGPATAIDERQPLLVANEYDAENPAPEDILPAKKRSWWTIGWYSTLSVLGVIAVVLFIKGFIDADDVEVGAVLTARCRCSPIRHAVRSGEGAEECSGWRSQRGGRYVCVLSV